MTYELSVYTDSSKKSTGSESVVFIEKLGLSKSIKLNNQCSVFKVEILAIKQVCRILTDKGTK